jgi:dihydrodipicolinate synthase/N-acetylneuraminate lyase
MSMEPTAAFLNSETRSSRSTGWLRIRGYQAPPGLSTPVVTVLDRNGEIIAEEQRAVIRYAVQGGVGAGIIFAAGTTGEWNRLRNSQRQAVIGIAVEECARLSRNGPAVEAWAGVTAPSVAETIENLEFALETGADAAVVAPLAISNAGEPVEFVTRTLGNVFERRGRSLPLFLYDNAEIAAPGAPDHLSSAGVRRMARLSYVSGIKVTAGKEVLAAYARPSSYFKLGGDFALYPGNAYLIFDLFKPADGLTRRMRGYWNRYLTPRLTPHGIVAGGSNVLPREWRRSWQVCRNRDDELMRRYEPIMQSFRVACEFPRPGEPYKPVIACLKTALADLGVISSDAVAPGTPGLDTAERREFLRRFRDIRRRAAATLEPEWFSGWSERPLDSRIPVDG